MRAKLPDLNILQERAEQAALSTLQKHGFNDFLVVESEAEMWQQIWPNTSAGASNTKDYMAGDAMTPGYVTIFTVRAYTSGVQHVVYALFYGDDPSAGLIGLPSELEDTFFDDWKNHHIPELWQALERY